MNNLYSMYCERSLNGTQELEGSKIVKYDGEDVLALTHEYYGFNEVKTIDGDNEYTSVSNGMFYVDGLNHLQAKEILEKKG